MFTPQAIGEIVAADTIADVYNLIHDIQAEYADFIHIVLVFNGQMSV